MSEILNVNKLKDAKALENIESLSKGHSVDFSKYAEKLREIKERDNTVDISTVTKDQLINYRKNMTVGGRRRKIIKEILGLDNNVFEAVRATYLFIYED